MTPDEIAALAQQVVALSVAFGPLVMLLMELVVKRWVVRAKMRRLWSGIVSVVLPGAYMFATGTLSWQAAPLVMVLAWCISQAGHASRNAVDRRDATRS